MRKASIVIAGFMIVFGVALQAYGVNLTIPIAGRVTVELLFSEAAYSNTLAITSPNASIAIKGCKLEPAVGISGLPILSEKKSQRGCRVELDSNPATQAIDGFPANTTFEFELCAQTDADADCEYIWSSDPGQNSDNFDHVATTSPTNYPNQIFQLAWEDLPNGGDGDFNDLIAVVRVEMDTDGDGLWDDWEEKGIDTNGDGTIDYDLHSLGADPDRQDIFVEIDYMDCNVAGGDCIANDTHSHEPKQAARNAVNDAFKNAPINNPDGSTGITLHVDVDDAIPHQNMLSIPVCSSGTGIGNFDDVKADPAYFGSTNPRRFTHHYAIFGHRQNANKWYSGCGEIHGNDFLVTFGDWNTICVGRGNNNILNTLPSGDDLSPNFSFISTGPNLRCDTTAAGDDNQVVANGSSPTSDLDGDTLDDRTVGDVEQQATTLMHELGHNLNLHHGGDVDTGYKPNYISVMNYSFQPEGIPPTDPDGSGPLYARVDYSATDLPDLNENNLNEPAGIADGTDDTRYYCPDGNEAIGPGSGAIDWNCDGDGGIDPSPANPIVAVDINRDGIRSVLTGFDDWDHLKLDFQNSKDFEDGVHETFVDVEEMDYATSLQIAKQVSVDIRPGSCPNPLNLTCKGKLPVAILGTEKFDVKTIRPDSIKFTRAEYESGPPLRYNYEDVATPVQGELCECDDLNGDGYMDLTLKFSVPDLVESLNLIGAGEAIALTLRGETLEGTPILGQDCILIVGNIEKQCDSDFDCDADVDGSDAAVFKENFGRSRFNNPCGQLPGDACPGDFKCDGDVDGEDASIFKSEFGTILR